MNLNQPGIPRAPLPSATSDVAYNKLVDQVDAMTRTLAGMGGKGRELPAIHDIFYGLITSKPPQNVADFKQKDARYWVTRCQSITTLGTTDNFGVEADHFANCGLYDATVCATNLNELPAQKDDHTPADNGGTHSLADNTVVLVFAMSTRQNPQNIFYAFTYGGTSPPLLRVLATTWSDSTVLGQGWYRARIVTANVASANPTTSATDAGLFTSGTTDVLAVNEAEFGLSDRLVDPSANQITFLGSPLGSITTAGTFKGVAVYSLFGFQPQICTP